MVHDRIVNVFYRDAFGNLGSCSMVDVKDRFPRDDEQWRNALPAEIPSRCAALARLASEHDWWARITYARGTPTSPRGEGMATVTRTEPRESEDGRVLLTSPPAKKDGSPGIPRPRVRKVVTDELVVVDLIMLWLEREGCRIVGTWLDGKFDGSRSYPLGITYSSAELAAILRSDWLTWESVLVELQAV